MILPFPTAFDLPRRRTRRTGSEWIRTPYAVVRPVVKFHRGGLTFVGRNAQNVGCRLGLGEEYP